MRVVADHFLTFVALCLGLMFAGTAVGNFADGDIGWGIVMALLALPGFLALHWTARGS